MDLFVVAQSCARQSSGRHYKVTILVWPDKASCTLDELGLQRLRGLHLNRAIGKIDKLEAWSLSMELRHLRYFRAVAENHGFSRGARLLHVSQSAISEQIADLEREVGVPLLSREQQAVRLTPHGEIFLEGVLKVLAAADQAVEMAQRSARGEIGTLTLGFFTGGTGTLVPHIVRLFRRRRPGVRVSIVEMIPRLQSEALLNGTLDVGFTRPLDPPLDRQLRSEVLYPDSLIAVLPKGHRKAGAPVDLRALAAEQFVLIARETSPALFDKIIACCSNAGFSPQIAATAGVWSSAVLLVQAGTGIAILPSNLQQGGLRDLAFCPLTNRGASIDLVMAWSPEHDTPIRSEFLDLVRAYRDRKA
jgi:DNA-binding transcriptional LysR family regulator